MAAADFMMTLVRMAVGNRIGVDVKVEGDILSPMFGSLVIEIPAGERIDRLMSGSVYTVLGSTTAGRNITVNGKSEDIKELTKRWQEPLEGVFPVRTPDFRDSADDTPVEQPVYIQRNTSGPAVRIAKPRVVIPAFPGTNCEMDSARAFRKAGAEADIHIIRNQTTAQLEESIRQLEQKIRSSQIIMIPGGFSGGDEPDGSAKFITAVFRNPGISDAVSDLLENRDKGIGTLVLAYQTKVFRYTGVMPQLERCAICGEEKPAFKFSVEEGGVICRDCFQAMENLGPHALIYDIKFGILDILKYFTVNPLKKLENIALKEDAGKLLQEIIREYAAYYLDVSDLKKRKAYINLKINRR